MLCVVDDDDDDGNLNDEERLPHLYFLSALI